MKHLRSLRWGSLPVGFYVFAGVFLLRLLVLVRLTASPFLLPSQGDMHFYDDWAQRILHGQWTDYRAFYGLPLYPYLLAFLYKLFGHNPFFPGLLQACADSGTAVILFNLGRHLFGDGTNGETPKESATAFACRARGTFIGLLAAAGWAFFAPEQAYSAILMPTALAVFVFWFVIWQIVKRRQIPKAFGLLFVGLLIGITAMGIATVLFLIPLVLAAIFLKWENSAPPRAAWRQRIVAATLIVCGVVLGASPCWMHNYLLARDSVFLSAHSGVNFWIGNNPQANGYPSFPPGLKAGQEALLQGSITAAEQAAGHSLKRSQVSAFWSEKARGYIRANPGEWLGLLALKFRNFWSAFQYDDLSIITNFREQGLIFPGLSFGLVAAFALPGMLFGVIKVGLSRWVAAGILLHLASLLPVFVTERYRLAAVPGLLIFAAYGIARLWVDLVQARHGRAAVFLSLLALATTFVSRPQNDPTLWALDLYNSGWQALESKNLPLAQKKLDLAYAYVPDNAEINFTLGNLRLEQGDKFAAKSYYASTLKLNRDHDGAWNNLGVLALQERRWELAIKFLQGALRASPNDAKTHYLLAQAYLEQGDTGRARSEVELALRLRPDQPEFVELSGKIPKGE